MSESDEYFFFSRPSFSLPASSTTPLLLSHTKKKKGKEGKNSKTAGEWKKSVRSGELQKKKPIVLPLWALVCFHRVAICCVVVVC